MPRVGVRCSELLGDGIDVEYVTSQHRRCRERPETLPATSGDPEVRGRFNLEPEKTICSAPIERNRRRDEPRLDLHHSAGIRLDEPRPLMKTCAVSTRRLEPAHAA